VTWFVLQSLVKSIIFSSGRTLLSLARPTCSPIDLCGHFLRCQAVVVAHVKGNAYHPPGDCMKAQIAKPNTLASKR
jgi:hypothetical protein